MYVLSEIIRKGLTETTAVTDIVGTKIFPLVADQEDTLPYTTYQVSKNSELTKDGGGDYTITILSFETTYDKALLLNEAVMEALETVNKDNKDYRFYDAGATPYYSEQKEFYVQQTITIKK